MALGATAQPFIQKQGIGMRVILGLDVGIRNLAMVSVLTSDRYEIVDILGSKVVDVTKVKCAPDCKLHHSNGIVDRMSHFFVRYATDFDTAEEILIEAQPVLVGLVHVEALIFSRYRHKARLVQPVSVQKHFKWPRCDYEAKKQAAVDTAHPYMPNLDDVTRKHDLADAFCLVLYDCQIKQREMVLKDWKTARRDVGQPDGAGNPFMKFACRIDDPQM